MTPEEIAAAFTATFGTIEVLTAKLAMLSALLDVEVANAGALIAQEQGAQAQAAAELIRQSAQAEANAAKAAFAMLVAQAAAQG
jgi:hypothetical protein